MRDIRFRAWDGYRMYYFNNFEWTLDYNDISGWNIVKNLPPDQLKGRKWDAGESSATAEHFQLMQFTGLHDKNGKEIFEGDLVNYKYLEGDKAFEVIFDEDVAAFKIAKDEYYMGFLGDKKRHEIEVIGNIYQHNHLLK